MKKYIILLFVVVGAWSCEDFLDVRPKSQIKEEDLFSTSEGCEEALYGVYASLATSNLYGFNLRCGDIEVMGQAYEVNMQGSVLMTKNFEMNDELRASMASIWKEMYQVIGYTNNLISALEKKGSGTFVHLNLYKGEALGIRGFLHFDLLRMFAPHVERNPDAKGIPYVKAWTVGVTPFSTVKEGYAEVIADLKASEKYLLKGEEEIKVRETDFTRNRRIHFNLQAAQATLARVYWMKGELDSALIYAEKVIGSNTQRLATISEIGKMNAGTVGDKETIFGVYNIDLMAKYKPVFYNEGFNTGGKPVYTPRSDYNDLFKNEAGGNDIRLKSWFVGEKISPTSDVQTIIFEKFFTGIQIKSPGYYKENSDPIRGCYLITLPEMYLIATEALLEEEPDRALNYFDTFIASRGLVKFADRQGAQRKDLTIGEIYKERTKELMGDGQEFFAMKKQLRSLPDKQLSEGDYVFIIPDTEFDFRQDEIEK